MPKIIVTEEQWIEKGMEYFSEGGSEALIIEKMAKTFGCSKSSFYWYFNNRNSFIQRIVEEWKQRATKQVIIAASVQASEVIQLLTLLNQMFSTTKMGDFLFYLRKLALVDVAYRGILDEIEQLRINHVQDLLTRAGLSPDNAYQRSWLLYHYYLGWYERHKHVTLSDDEVQRHVQMFLKEWMGGAV